MVNGKQTMSLVPDINNIDDNVATGGIYSTATMTIGEDEGDHDRDVHVVPGEAGNDDVDVNHMSDDSDDQDIDQLFDNGPTEGLHGIQTAQKIQRIRSKSSQIKTTATTSTNHSPNTSIAIEVDHDRT